MGENLMMKGGKESREEIYRKINRGRKSKIK